jgi:Tfp pilus assembly protein PilE
MEFSIIKLKKGISIVELMMFILVIAILSSVFIPNISRLYRHSREASLRSNMFTLKIAAEDFASMAHGLYPKDPTYSVENVLSDYGIVSTNQKRVADNCPATCFEVNTGSGNALLPGEQTYINPFLFNGNCLDVCSGSPAWAVISPYSSGQGTVYWYPGFSPGTYSTKEYYIFGVAYRYVLFFSLRSEY